LILLDTNACIALITGRKPSVRDRLSSALDAGEVVTVPSITSFELWFGAANSDRIEANRQALAYVLHDFDILPFDGEDARIAGAIRFDLQRSGRPIGTYDVLIAAQTLRYDALLVTANVREFSRVPNLRWENWET
jgi:tRNA(fMet)-specific endonuclease VapC